MGVMSRYNVSPIHLTQSELLENPFSHSQQRIAFKRPHKLSRLTLMAFNYYTLPTSASAQIKTNQLTTSSPSR